MKNVNKVLGTHSHWLCAVALVAVIGFSMVTCDNGNGNNGGDGGAGGGGGNTRTQCSSCEGTGLCKYDDYMLGYVTCGGCYGSGYNYRGNLCGACDGFGFNKCWVCSGSGKCQICYGTGYTTGTGGGGGSGGGGGGTEPTTPVDTGTIIFKNNNSFTLTSVYVTNNGSFVGLAMVSANGSRTFSNVTVGNIRIEASGTSGFTAYDKYTTFTLSKNETKTVTATSSGLSVSGSSGGGGGSGSGLSAPTGVTAVRSSSTTTTINISWNAVSGANLYTIWFLSSDGSAYMLDGTSSTTSFASTSKVTDTAWSFAVIAKNTSTGIESPFSTRVTVPATSGDGNVPSAPTGLTAVRSSTRPTDVNLSWNAVSGANDYTIWHSTDATNWSQKGMSKTPTFIAYNIDTGITNYFKIIAWNSTGQSSPSYVTLAPNGNSVGGDPGGGGSSSTILTLERSTGNDYDVWNCVYEIPLTGGKITAGETYVFSYALKSNVAISDLWITLIDNSDGVENYWKRLSDYRDIYNIPANTTVTGTLNFTATSSASSAAAAANKIQLGVDYSNLTSQPTLTFTTFTFSKN